MEKFCNLQDIVRRSRNQMRKMAGPSIRPRRDIRSRRGPQVDPAKPRELRKDPAVIQDQPGLPSKRPQVRLPVQPRLGVAWVHRLTIQPKKVYPAPPALSRQPACEASVIADQPLPRSAFA